MKNLDGRLIFDNGGGLTVQLPGFARYYGGYSGCIEQAAEDISNYLYDGTTDGWEGHEEDAAGLDPEYDEIRNGGYRIYTIPDILEEAKSDDSTGWYNIDTFCVALTKNSIRNKIEKLSIGDIVSVAFSAMIPGKSNGHAVFDPDTEELVGVSLGQNEWIPNDTRIYLYNINANVYGDASYNECGDILSEDEYAEYKKLLEDPDSNICSVSDYLKMYTKDTFENRFEEFLVWCAEEENILDWENIEQQISQITG